MSLLEKGFSDSTLYLRFVLLTVRGQLKRGETMTSPTLGFVTDAHSIPPSNIVDLIDVTKI
jgi:hypothetical protein